MPEGAAAIVLAGGKSTRLGRDKAAELLLGVPLLQRVLDGLSGLAAERVVVRRAGQELPRLTTPGVVTLEDAFPDSGPLGGVCTGLASIEAGTAIVVACDMPLLQPALLAALLRLAGGVDAVVPLSDGLPQTLCAVYARSCLPAMRDQIESGDYTLSHVLAKLRTRYLQPEEWRRFDAEGASFHNVNREEDLERVRAMLEAGAGAPPVFDSAP